MESQPLWAEHREDTETSDQTFARLFGAETAEGKTADVLWPRRSSQRALADRDRFPGRDRMGRIPAVCRRSQLRCRYGLGTRFVNCNMGKKCQVFPADQGGWQRGEVGTGCLGRSHGVWSGNTDAWGAGNPPLDLYLILVAIKGFGTGSDGT